MGLSLAYKILKNHLVSGELVPGKEIGIKIDQTLTQDATGTMAWLQFEAMGIPQVRTELSVSYVDHNTLQSGFENADDHRFLQAAAAKYGSYFSKPGTGICHQVHLERFGVPGKTLLGSDSHTPTGGGLGMIAIGAGGLDVAVAMGGGPFHLPCPEVINVRLRGKLQPWVTAKDIILKVLQILTVKGGVGKIIEYSGGGAAKLTVPERATITNMGAELGATTSIFPSDAMTRKYLRSMKREEAWSEWKADPRARYSRVIRIDLSGLEPLVAQPSSPDNVIEVSKVQDVEVQQVIIGSCTNSSYEDLSAVAKMVEGKVVHPNVSACVAPGSKQVMANIAQSGAFERLIRAGFRILETACGPCIGMGQSPGTGWVSARTFNRNFPGRSGTKGDRVYLCSPQVAAATALAGHLCDPRTLGEPPKIRVAKEFIIDDRTIIPPDTKKGEISRGPNIQALPIHEPMPDSFSAEVLLKVEDNITTDHISPAGSRFLPLRSNIPALSQFVYHFVDETFAGRAQEKRGGFIVGGDNYGQGSSREHAALCPMFLGVKAVLGKSFARIHRANLVNFGIVPLQFADPGDYDDTRQGDVLEMPRVKEELQSGGVVTVKNQRSGKEYQTTHGLSARQVEIMLEGGLLNYTKKRAARP
jgi:aconitate hydratase